MRHFSRPRAIQTHILATVVALACICAPGCLSAPQEQSLRSAEGGDRIGSTPSVVIHTAGNATLNVFSTVDNTHPPATTQPSVVQVPGATTINQTVSGASSASSSPSTSGDKSHAGQQTGGVQDSKPTNDVKPSTTIEIPITPGAGTKIGG